jgi:hypothetical protein
MNLTLVEWMLTGICFLLALGLVAQGGRISELERELDEVRRVCAGLSERLHVATQMLRDMNDAIRAMASMIEGGRPNV